MTAETFKGPSGNHYVAQRFPWVLQPFNMQQGVFPTPRRAGADTPPNFAQPHKDYPASMPGPAMWESHIPPGFARQAPGQVNFGERPMPSVRNAYDADQNDRTAQRMQKDYTDIVMQAVMKVIGRE